MKDTKTNVVPVMTFKEAIEAHHKDIDDFVAKQKEQASKREPSKLDFFKYNAREYVRFLIDPTLIAGHVIKIIICIVLLVYLTQDYVMTDLPQFKTILQYLLMTGIGFLVVTSATHSMLLPMITIGASVAGETIFKNHSIFSTFDPIVLQYTLAIGICGICVAVFFRPSVKLYG